MALVIAYFYTWRSFFWVSTGDDSKVVVRTEMFKNPDLINDDNGVLFPGTDDLYDSTLSKGSRRHVSTQFDDSLDRKAARGGVWKNDPPDRSCQPRAA